jgi:hypothetical protein
VIRRARSGPEREHFFLKERQHAIVCQNRWCRLKQERFVGRTAAFRDEQQLIAVFTFRIDLNLRGHVRLGVLFLEHGNRRELRIPQVTPEIRVARTFRERCLIVAGSENHAAFLPHDNGGAGVLAHWQDATGCDIRILQKIEGDELVIVGRFRVIKNLA